MNALVRDYIVERARELQRLDPDAFAEIRHKHEVEFNEPATAETAIADTDRCCFWLHWMGDWRVARLKETSAQEARSYKKRPRRGLAGVF